MIDYCPRCGAKVTDAAKFCPNCGLKRRGTRPVPAAPATSKAALSSPNSEGIAPQQPNVPERGQEIPAISKRAVQPNVRRVPVRPNSGTSPAQQFQPVQTAPTTSQEMMQKSIPATNHPHNIPPTPVPPTQLIRPVGSWATQIPSPNPAQSAEAQWPKLNRVQPFQQALTDVSTLQPVPQQDVSAFQAELQTPIPQTPQQYKQNSPLPAWPGQLPIPQSDQPIEQVRRQQGRSSPSPHVPIGQKSNGVAKGRPSFIEAHEEFGQNDNSSESYVATSVAAERWRTSWRDRQRSEAGPATSASRGQSLVQEPLMAMQNSLVRMRAVLLPKRSQANLRFWITFLLMVCTIGGLTAYIAATFQAVPDSASQSLQKSVLQPPNLSISGTPTTTIAQGQILRLHGDNFAIGAAISFVLDGTVTIKSTDGRLLTVLTSDQGSFNVTLPIASTWAAGPHVIAAHDNKHNQIAYLTIDVSLGGPAETTSKELTLSTNQLTFQAIMGQGSPKEQFVTLTNMSATTPLLWTARAITNNNLSWLNVDESTSSGHLIDNGITSVGINANIDALPANTRPYSGEIIFTINASEQLTLPVVLQLSNGTPEISLNPNPIIGLLAPVGGSCQANTTLLVVNLSNEEVSWSISLNNVTSTHIAFLQLGKPKVKGMLAPTGQQGNSTLLTLRCIHVKNGDVYNFAFIANTIIWPGEVTIQTTK